jgi:hypothetical protein
LQGSGKVKHADSMRLVKNSAVVSISISGYGGFNNLFGTAIVNLLAGDQVISFNRIIFVMQLQQISL